LRCCVIPLLASLQGGVAASSRKCCEATEVDAAGVVFLFLLNRKTTPASRSAEASRYLLDRSATPPCGDARRGVLIPRHRRIDFQGPCLNPATHALRILKTMPPQIRRAIETAHPPIAHPDNGGLL